MRARRAGELGVVGVLAGLWASSAGCSGAEVQPPSPPAVEAPGPAEAAQPAAEAAATPPAFASASAQAAEAPSVEAPEAAGARRCEPLRVSPLPLAQVGPDIDREVPPIEDDTGQVMRPVYEKLAAIARGRGSDHVRVAVYGDSNMVADWITGGLRRTLQERLGDGGHGFVALGRPWPGYVHMDVKHDLVKESWMIFAASTQPVQDGRYGFAGITVQSMGWGARTWVETAGERSPVGRTVSRVSVHYLRGPKMGGFEVRVDGKVDRVVETQGGEFEAAVEHVRMPDAPHKVTFVSTSSKPVRLFGATLERDAPSVVVDSLGVGASNTKVMLRQEHTIYRQALANRGYDLVIFLHGTFDVVPWGGPEKHAAWVREMIEVHRAALPEVAILILSPPDRAPSLGALRSRPEPAQAAAEKRAIARANRTAYWDFLKAMGGDLSIVRFRKRKMADGDLIHFNAPGGQYMGNRLAFALWRDFMGYLDQHPEAGCDQKVAPAPKVSLRSPSGAASMNRSTPPGSAAEAPSAAW